MINGQFEEEGNHHYNSVHGFINVLPRYRKAPALWPASKIRRRQITTAHTARHYAGLYFYK